MRRRSDSPVKRLPFERAYLVDSKTCERCSGSGQYALGKPCYDCGQVGRRFTPAGIALILEVCELLGIEQPIDEHRRRWNVLADMPITAKRLRPGMRVRPARYPGDRATPFRVVASNRSSGFGHVLTFTDGSRLSIDPLKFFDRELTDDELARAEVVMADRRDKGAVAASTPAD